MKKLVFIIPLLLSGAALAQEPKPAKMDTNADGYVSFEEFQARHVERAEERFQRIDADGDGLLSADEISEARKQMKRGGKRRSGPGRHLRRLDADDNGALSFEELQAGRRVPDINAFQAADLDGNGELDRDELRAMHKANRANREKTQD